MVVEGSEESSARRPDTSPSGGRGALERELAWFADELKLELPSLKPAALAEQHAGVDPDVAFFVQAAKDVRGVLRHLFSAEALYESREACELAAETLAAYRALLERRPEIRGMRGSEAAPGGAGEDEPSAKRRREAPAAGVAVRRTRFLAAEDAHYFNSYAGLEIHEEMLRDDVRTPAYRDAIASSGLTGAVVLDVGAGTGILSMFCARAGARKVYGIEASDVARHATAIVAANGLSDAVTIVRGRVEDVEELPEKVDAIVSEWMGYGLLYESMLNSVVVARDRFLKPGGKMLPSHARLYIAPFTDEDFFANRIEFWRDVHGFRMPPLEEAARKGALGRPAVDLLSPENLLADPALVREIDCGTVALADLAETLGSFRFECLQSGALHGFALFFDVEFAGSRAPGGKGPVRLSTHPRVGPQHWKQTLLCVPAASAQQDDVIEGRLSMRPGGCGGRYMDIGCEWRVAGGTPQNASWSMDYEGL